jgi:hypothetical protein
MVSKLLVVGSSERRGAGHVAEGLNAGMISEEKLFRLGTTIAYMILGGMDKQSYDGVGVMMRWDV